MFQGFKQLRLRNWESNPELARSIDAVVLTHGHLDHSGLLPRLVRDGFDGPIHCSPATADLLRILLLDAAYLQEEDAKRANRRGYTKHRPALPLYTTKDAEAALGKVRPVAMDTAFDVGSIQATLFPAGHMLGAASVQFRHRDRTALFSGDVGRLEDPLMHPPRPFQGADLLVVESTYGDRRHGDEDSLAALERVVNRVCGRGGVLMIPAFAIGRSQAVMHLLATLRADGRIPDVPTYLNSPMAISASEIFCDHPEGHRLAPGACQAMCGVATFVRTAEESKRLNRSSGPMILIAGSGMATGGRILHHLKAFAGDERNGILLVGFQAGGTRGAAIDAGAEQVKIHGRYIDIRAERFRMQSLSGHADWQELLGWLGDAPEPEHVLINHGEPGASDAFRQHLSEEIGWQARVAEAGQTIDLEAAP
jgi:metallo-beta-lactamase family protein